MSAEFPPVGSIWLRRNMFGVVEYSDSGKFWRFEVCHADGRHSHDEWCQGAPEGWERDPEDPLLGVPDPDFPPAGSMWVSEGGRLSGVVEYSPSGRFWRFLVHDGYAHWHGFWKSEGVAKHWTRDPEDPLLEVADDAG